MCLLAGFGSAGAHMVMDAMVVTMADGAKEYYAISESPQLTFPGSEIKIVTKEVEASFERANVADLRFMTLLFDSLDETDRTAPYVFSYADRVVTAKGADVKAIELYDTEGRRAASAKAHDGVATVSLADMPKGVYIVRITGHSSVKIKI